jgi:5-methyltetrahydropteroyltriglutamate--homocysteine methyltransferase
LLAFAEQRLEELVILTRALNEGRAAILEELEQNAEAFRLALDEVRVYRRDVRERLAALTEDDFRRQSPYEMREPLQRARFHLPLFPTTTIGSFPQTPDVRQARARWRAGKLSDVDYWGFIRERIAEVIRRQEEIGLDVLVHGEYERADMVEYFAEQLEGFVLTEHGWVQSYGEPRGQTADHLR